MTRDEALTDWYDCQRQIEQLMEKAINLKKIIFSEVGVPQRAIPKSDRMQGNVRSNSAGKGKTQQIVVRVMSEHGGKMRVKEIATLAEITTNCVYSAVSKLVELGVVHKEKDKENIGQTIYSLAVYRDRSELNHL